MKFIIVSAVICALLFTASDALIYVRWGRTTCDGAASSLMDGYASSGNSHLLGNGANYLCLTKNPEWGNILPGVQTAGRLDGVTYAFKFGAYSNTDKAPFSWENNQGQNIDMARAPCVVCYRPDRSDMHMFAGRLSCPNEAMSLEYNGYLVSAYYGDYKSEFICLDGAPETVPGSQNNGNYDVNDILPVQASCSGLVCPPYVNGNELSCAVCSI